MKTRLSIAVVSAAWILAGSVGSVMAGETASNGRFQGTYCDGAGDAAWLRLIDESFAHFHANPRVPNLTMVYHPDWDTFQLGANWDAWWIQNSYGFTISAVPFLPEPYFSILQRSYDLFWDNQGDGQRMGLWYGSATATHFSSLVGPDGCLGDAAQPGEIAYKQGDGDANVHDWFTVRANWPTTLRLDEFARGGPQSVKSSFGHTVGNCLRVVATHCAGSSATSSRKRLSIPSTN